MIQTKEDLSKLIDECCDEIFDRKEPLANVKARLYYVLKKQLTLTDVVASVLCVSDEMDCLNITKGKKYTLIESDNVFFRVVNDLGNEQLYYNYRFKRL